MESIERYDVKLERLRELVADAERESRGETPVSHWAHGGPFNATSFSTAHMDALVGILRNTDAIHVLHEALNVG